MSESVSVCVSKVKPTSLLLLGRQLEHIKESQVWWVRALGIVSQSSSNWKAIQILTAGATSKANAKACCPVYVINWNSRRRVSETQRVFATRWPGIPTPCLCLSAMPCASHSSTSYIQHSTYTPLTYICIHICAGAQLDTLEPKTLCQTHWRKPHADSFLHNTLIATVQSISNAKRVAFQREGWGVAAAITRSHVSGSCPSDRAGEEKSEGN